MTKQIFVGNLSNSAVNATNVFVGNSSSVARKATGVFVGNSSGVAVKVWPTGGGSRVPDGYQEVEYIKTKYTNNYYDTGVKPNSNTRVVIDFAFDSISAEYDNYKVSAPFYTPFDNSSIDAHLQTGFSLFLDYSLQNAYLRCCFGPMGTTNYYDIQRFSTPLVEEEIQSLKARKTIDIGRER